MTRRDLLTKTGMLLGAMQLSDSFKFDLVERLAKTILPEAQAATPAPQRLLEICFREGLPMIQFAASPEFASLPSAKYSNIPYAGSALIPGGSGTNLHFAPAAQRLVSHAANFAITQNIATDGSHTDLFNIRQGATGMGLTTPIVTLANANTTGSLISGVQWPGPVRNVTNGLRDLVQVAGPTDFINLFKNARLRITDPELSQILSVSKQISSNQASLLESKLNRAKQVGQTQASAVQLFKSLPPRVTDLTDLAPGLNSPNDVKHPPGCCSTTTFSFPKMRLAVGHSLRAFQYNLINSSLVTFDLGDWHPLQTANPDDTSVTNITAAMAETLADAIEFLKNTPEPAGNPGQMLWDTTVIVVTSEFTRAVSPLGWDNADGETQGMILIGKNVSGNFYGSFDVSGNGHARALGFDPKTGATSPTLATPSTVQAYHTIRRLIGQTTSFGENQLAIGAMLRT